MRVTLAVAAAILLGHAEQERQALEGRALALARSTAYAAERDAALPPGHAGPRPAGGVAGTRVGVKCLHAHYAWYLAGGDDPVGRWVHERIRGPVALGSGE